MNFGSGAVNFHYEGNRLMSIDDGTGEPGGENQLEYDANGDLIRVYSTQSDGTPETDPAVEFVYSGEEVVTATYPPFVIRLPEETEHETFGRVRWMHPGNLPIILTQIMNWAHLRPGHLRTQTIWSGTRSATNSRYYANQEITNDGMLRHYDVFADLSDEKIGAAEPDLFCN
jgi:hypothetical protein